MPINPSCPSPALSRRWIAIVGMFALFFALTYCYQRGAAREAGASQDSMRPIVPTILVGVGMPSLIMLDRNGKRTLLDEVRDSKRWTLVALASPDCTDCREEMRSLAATDHKRFDAIMILKAKPLVPLAWLNLGILQRREEPHRSFSIFASEDLHQFDRLCDTNRLPHNVLLDPYGKVRLVFDGFARDVVQHLDDFIVQRDYRVRYDGGRRLFKSSCSITVNGQSGRADDILRSGWTIITFAKSGCPACVARMTEMARYANLPGIQNLYLYRSSYECFRESNTLARLGLNSAWSDSARLVSNPRFPYTVVLWKGVPIFADSQLSGAGQTDLDLWKEIDAVVDKRVAIVPHDVAVRPANNTK